jgi:hypothetical protein
LCFLALNQVWRLLNVNFNKSSPFSFLTNWLFLTDQTVNSAQYTSVEEIATDKGNNSCVDEIKIGKGMFCWKITCIYISFLMVYFKLLRSSFMAFINYFNWFCILLKILSQLTTMEPRPETWNKFTEVQTLASFSSKICYKLRKWCYVHIFSEGTPRQLFKFVLNTKSIMLIWDIKNLTFYFCFYEQIMKWFYLFTTTTSIIKPLIPNKLGRLEMKIDILFIFIYNAYLETNIAPPSPL